MTYVYLFPDPGSVADCPVRLNLRTQLLAFGRATSQHNCAEEIPNNRLVFFNSPVQELQAVGRHIWHDRVYMRVTLSTSSSTRTVLLSVQGC